MNAAGDQGSGANACRFTINESMVRRWGMQWDEMCQCEKRTTGFREHTH